MFKFTTYKFGPDVTGGWYWQVTQTGPQASSIIIIAARSGHGFATEQAAIENYKEFVKWASQPPTTPPGNP